MADSLDEAWAETEALLPERWWIETDDAIAAFGLSASGPDDEADQCDYPGGRIMVEDRTLLGALRALTVELKERIGRA